MERCLERWERSVLLTATLPLFDWRIMQGRVSKRNENNLNPCKSICHAVASAGATGSGRLVKRYRSSQAPRINGWSNKS